MFSLLLALSKLTVYGIGLVAFTLLACEQLGARE
jgi:hypothetical protein